MGMCLMWSTWIIIVSNDVYMKMLTIQLNVKKGYNNELSYYIWNNTESLDSMNRIIHRNPAYYKYSNGKLLLVSVLYLFLYIFTAFAPTITCVCFKLNHVYIISLVIIYISRRQVKVCTLETWPISCTSWWL